MKNLLLSDQKTPSKMLDGLLWGVQDSDNIAPLTLHHEEEVRASKEGILHR